MDVSIIIINYNTYNYTSKCIQSVLAYTKQLQFEIILIDNASTECNPELFKKKFPEISLIKSPTNLGFSGGNNLGLEIAKGQYILLLNSDTELVDNSIKYIYEHFIANSFLGAATVRIAYPNGDSQPAAKPFFLLERHFLESTRLCHVFKQRFKKLNIEYNYEESFECDWIWGTFFYFPKKNLALMGGKLTDTFFMYCEDIEWCWIFKKNGLKNYHLADRYIVHHVGISTNTKKRNQLLAQSHLKFVKKYHGIFTFIIEYILLQIDMLYSKYYNFIKR
jgi:GT2 family glycosyltransferase